MQSPCIQQQQQQTAKHSKILADLEGCQQPCSGASCRCSTVPRQLQYIADALSCFESAQDSEPASPLAQLHLRAKQLLQLCDALVQHNHSQAALVAATEAFYRMIAQQAPHASTSSLAAAAPPVLSELIAHGVKDSLVMKRCVIDKLQPLCDQWYKMLSRMSKVFEALPRGNQTFSAASARKLQRTLAQGPTSHSELSTAISSSHVVLVLMGAVLRLHCVVLHESQELQGPLGSCREGGADSIFTAPGAEYVANVVPCVTKLAFQLLQAVVVAHQLEKVGVSVATCVPPAAAAAALQFVCLMVTDLGALCRKASEASVKATLPDQALSVLGNTEHTAIVCNNAIAVYGSLLCRQQQDGSITRPTASEGSSSGGGDGSGSLAQGLLLRRADRLQAKPDSWDQEFAGTHSRCWQQLYQQHWADLGFPPDLLHPVIDSLCALNSSVAGGSSSSSGGGSNGTGASSISQQHGPVSTQAALDAVCAAVHILHTMQCSLHPTVRGYLLVRSVLGPENHPQLGTVALPGSALGGNVAAVLLSKTPLWLLQLSSRQLQRALQVLPDLHCSDVLAQAGPLVGQAHKVVAESPWWEMWDEATTSRCRDLQIKQALQMQSMSVEAGDRVQHIVQVLGLAVGVMQQLMLMTGAVTQHQPLQPVTECSSNSAAASRTSASSSTSACDEPAGSSTLQAYHLMVDSCCATLLRGILRFHFWVGFTGMGELCHRQDSLSEQFAVVMQAAEAGVRNIARRNQQGQLEGTDCGGAQGSAAAGPHSTTSSSSSSRNSRMQQQHRTGCCCSSGPPPHPDTFRFVAGCVNWSACMATVTTALQLILLPDATWYSKIGAMSPEEQQLMLATVSLMLTCIKARRVLPASCEVTPVSPADVYVVLLLALHDARAAAAAATTNTPATTAVLPPLLHAALTLLGRWCVCEGQQLQQDSEAATKWLSSTETLSHLGSCRHHLPTSWQKQHSGGVEISPSRAHMVQQLLLLFEQVVQELPVLMQGQPQQPGVGTSSSAGRDLSPMGAADAAGGRDSPDSAAGSSSTTGSSALGATVVELLHSCTLQQLQAQRSRSPTPPVTGSASAAAATASPPAVAELPTWLCVFGRQLCSVLPSPFGCCNLSCANLATVSEGFALVRGKACVCEGCCVSDTNSSVTAGGQVEETTPQMAARYCSVACQAAHWPQHKATCVLLRQAHQEQEQHQQQHTETTSIQAAAGGAQRVVEEEQQPAVGERKFEGMAAAMAMFQEQIAASFAWLRRKGD